MTDNEQAIAPYELELYRRVIERHTQHVRDEINALVKDMADTTSPNEVKALAREQLETLHALLSERLGK